MTPRREATRRVPGACAGIAPEAATPASEAVPAGLGTVYPWPGNYPVLATYRGIRSPCQPPQASTMPPKGTIE
jgi:hypothetical protein